MELHVWGPLGDLVSFSPECLAAIYYINLVAPNELTVVQSSNTNLNSLGELPSLRHNGNNIGGFNAIVRYLKDQGYDLMKSDEKFSDRQRALDKAYSTYIDNKFTILAYYTEYLDNVNYEQVIRPLLSKLLPFPMQYNVPLNQRATAKSRCQEAGLTERQRPSASSQGISTFKKQLGVSKVQQQADEKEDKKREWLEDAKGNIKALNYITEVLETLFEDNTGLRQGKFMINEDELSTSDILLLAHLHLHLSGELESSVLRSLIDSEYGSLIGYYNMGMSQLNRNINIASQVPDADVPSLYNKIKSVFV